MFVPGGQGAGTRGCVSPRPAGQQPATLGPPGPAEGSFFVPGGSSAQPCPRLPAAHPLPSDWPGHIPALPAARPVTHGPGSPGTPGLVFGAAAAGFPIWKLSRLRSNQPGLLPGSQQAGEGGHGSLGQAPSLDPRSLIPKCLKTKCTGWQNLS